LFLAIDHAFLNVTSVQRLDTPEESISMYLLKKKFETLTHRPDVRSQKISFILAPKRGIIAPPRAFERARPSLASRHSQFHALPTLTMERASLVNGAIISSPARYQKLSTATLIADCRHPTNLVASHCLPWNF